jgi:hypothetical protein
VLLGHLVGVVTSLLECLHKRRLARSTWTNHGDQWALLSVGFSYRSIVQGAGRSPER